MRTKEFFKWVLAVLCGLLVWGIVKAIFFIMMIGSLAGSAASSGGSAPTLPKEGVLLMDMSSLVITEQTTESMPSMSLGSLDGLGSGSAVAQVGLYDAVRAIHKAAEDPGVKLILLKTDNGSTAMTNISEIRTALSGFRKSGKAVVAYGEAYTSGSYYLASIADKIYTTSHHGGNNFMLGLGGRMIFLKDLLDRLGVNYQLIRHGKYKSAGEMYILNAPSPENMEQNQAMIGSMWETIAQETAEARGISVDSLNYFIDNLSINFPEDMVKHNLADEVLSVEGYKDKMAVLAGKEKYKDVKFIPFKDYAAAKVKPNTAAKKKIAVIYADGNIVEQDDPNNISGDRFANIIAKVRADSTVKAVVLRVNSPGGTVLAASKIKEEIDLTRAVKPVVASYGAYAASGGYWISNSCDHIFSGAATLTGSIGCFSAIPEFGKAVKNVAHVNVVPVNSHKHSDMLSLVRPFNEEETRMMQDYVDDIYTNFVNIVAEGRDMTYEAVDEIAQGRVWTGADALKIGLVDELGSLEDAIAYAAALGGDPDVAAWNVTGYPKPLSMIQQIMAQFGTKDPNAEDIVENVLEGTPLEGIARALLDWQRTWTKGNGQLVFARLPFELEIK
ncbi:MAG: signal peptide peptidase SppA [Bacteroidales bacterium]|nr:signal peptide peptidase SppA [Bacteroidales bacterium]